MVEPVSRARFVAGSLPEAGASVALSREESAHARARRLADGDPVTVIDGSGREAEGRLVLLPGGGAEVRVERILPANDAGPGIWLGIAAVRAERLAWAAEKAGELGVARFVLVRTDRTQAFRAADRILPRLDRVVREAAKQSGSARWPRCEGPVDLIRALEAAPAENRLLVDFSGAPFPKSLSGSGAALLVGPEGGWSDEERTRAKHHGWTPTVLPAGTLRAETAAVAAVVLARAALVHA